MDVRSFMRPLLASAFSASLAACSAHSGIAPSFVPAQSQHFSSLESQQSSIVTPPPNCKNQTTTSTHSAVTDTLLTTGGHACIPGFGGLGGSIAYPGANPSVNLHLISSTTNYNSKLPSLGPGTPIFYLQIATKAATTFASSTAAGGGLTGASIAPGSQYTIYGQAVVGGFTFVLTPCYTKAVTGTHGGVIRGMGTLLKGLNVPSAATGVIEVYPGKSATGAC
ncbi:MAG TPA: hypothetical protein VGZ02_13465 [Candidatus Baltobacteraceae bacterium]|jgi:hypothetical protein|nr:hypothetical protein [Candidatus Baltobacteraceae bacterium]